MSSEIERYDLEQLEHQLQQEIKEVHDEVSETRQALELVGIDVGHLTNVRKYQREVMTGFKSVLFWLMDVHRMAEPTHFTQEKGQASKVKDSCYHKGKYCNVCGVISTNLTLQKNAEDYL
jgi:hypothetical protein